MPWYEITVEASMTVCIEAEDEEQARIDAYDECFTGFDKDTSEPKLLKTAEDIERSKRHADEVMPLPNAERTGTL